MLWFVGTETQPSLWFPSSCHRHSNIQTLGSIQASRFAPGSISHTIAAFQPRIEVHFSDPPRGLRASVCAESRVSPGTEKNELLFLGGWGTELLLSGWNLLWRVWERAPPQALHAPRDPALPAGAEDRPVLQFCCRI